MHGTTGGGRAFVRYGRVALAPLFLLQFILFSVSGLNYVETPSVRSSVEPSPSKAAPETSLWKLGSSNVERRDSRSLCLLSV